MNKNRILSSMLAACMAVSALTAGVSAANVPDATIDPDAKASLTIYKYDMTAASLDGVTESPTATGYADTSVENMYAPYAVQGVEFTVLKVADIETRSEVQADGSSEVEVVYGIDNSQNSDFLSALKLDADDAISTSGTALYFDSDTLIDALADAETSNAVSTKNKLESFISANGGTAMTVTDEAGRTSLENLDLGLYLVVETKVPEQITSAVMPFLVSLPMTQNDGDAWNYNVTCYPKNESGMPTLEKLVTEVTTAKELDYEPTATASDGDVLYYEILSTLPNISSSSTYLTEYTFADTLGKGIEYYTGSAAATDGLLKAVKLEFFSDTACTNLLATWNQTDETPKFTVDCGTADDGATTMIVSMTAAGLAEINPAYGGCTLRISYSAVMNDNSDVVYGEDGNSNSVRLTWKRTNTDYYDTLDDQCIVYTFGLDVTKMFSDNGTNYADVRFKIQNKTDGYYLIASRASDGIYYVNGENCKTANESAGTSFIPSSADGTLKIYGLEDDTYVITETATADGYTLLKNSITVVISTKTSDVVFNQNLSHCADGAASGVAYDNYMQTSVNAVRTASATVDGNAVTMKEVAKSANALAPLTIVNNRGFDLPQTGGSGSMALIICGMLAVAVSGFAFAVLSRKKH